MTGKSLIEMGSKANIIISFNAPTTINGKNYEIGEPYLYLKDVIMALSFSEQNKKNTSARNISYKKIINLDTISVGKIPMTRKLISLLLCYQNDISHVGKREFSTIQASGTTIYLNKMLYIQDNIFVYDSDFNKVEGISYDGAASNSISSVNFVDGQSYIISFSSEMVGTRYDFIQPDVPYLKLQIQGVGNINKNTKKVIINLSKVALDSVINFNFMPKDLINIPLNFIVLDNSDNYIIFEE